jgi:bifunctional DNase/RNase
VISSFAWGAGKRGPNVRSQSVSIRPLISALVLCAALGCAPRADEASLRPVHVEGVHRPAHREPVVELIEEGDSGRGLRIWVGEFKAQSIVRAIQREPVIRPNDDLLKDVPTSKAACRSLVTELRDGTYSAVIEVDLHGRELRLDARPSDAIAVALARSAGARLRVAARTRHRDSRRRERARHRAARPRSRIPRRTEAVAPELRETRLCNSRAGARNVRICAIQRRKPR